MQVDATPPLEDGERRALLVALELEAVPRTRDPSAQPWRAAGLREAVDDELETGYALSPRSTRGATRA